jgi:hypothetical protein
MIKRKFGICIDCPSDSPDRLLISDRCNIHYWKNRNKIHNQKKELILKNKPDENKTISDYFFYHNKNNNWICENCGTKLFPFDIKSASSCQAHILPKNIFPSVRSVIDNHLTLGGLYQNCFCHERYDSSWERAAGMKVFTLAKERFLKFKHLIHQDELKRLPEVFSNII